jgi:hypothetical protein
VDAKREEGESRRRAGMMIHLSGHVSNCRIFNSEVWTKASPIQGGINAGNCKGGCAEYGRTMRSLLYALGWGAEATKKRERRKLLTTKRSPIGRVEGDVVEEERM